MTRLPTILVILVFAGSLALALGASIVFARRLDRMGSRFGWPEAIVGLLTATAADAPELSSAVIAIAHGSSAVGVGVVVGSNLFNLAAMVGAVALVARAPIRSAGGSWCRVGRRALAVTGAATLVLAGALPAWIGLAACKVARSSTSRARPAHPPPGSLHPRAGDRIAAVEAAIALIALGSLGMVDAASCSPTADIPDVVVGMVVLAWLTSLPNAFTAFRLGSPGAATPSSARRFTRTASWSAAS
jgi:cation:H+ antiporter